MRKRRIFSLITTIILTTNLFVGITPASAKTENIRSQMEQKLKDSISYYEDNNYSANTNEDKIVIAPKKWMNIDLKVDPICTSWKRI